MKKYLTRIFSFGKRRQKLEHKMATALIALKILLVICQLILLWRA